MSGLTTTFKTSERTPEELKEMWNKMKTNTDEIKVEYKDGEKTISNVIHLSDSIKNTFDFWTPSNLASLETLQVTGTLSETQAPTTDLLKNPVDVSSNAGNFSSFNSSPFGQSF